MEEVLKMMDNNFSAEFHETEAYKKLERVVEQEAEELERLRQVTSSCSLFSMFSFLLLLLLLLRCSHDDGVQAPSNLGDLLAISNNGDKGELRL